MRASLAERFAGGGFAPHSSDEGLALGVTNLFTSKYGTKPPARVFAGVL
jgi:hypothetical protein